jgi:hypothetical protein
MPCRGVYSRKIRRFSLLDYVHTPRAQALPLEPQFLTARGSDHSSKLSLRNSCSNELNQNIRRSGRSRLWLQTLCYRATESPPLLLADSTCLLSTSSASYPGRFPLLPKKKSLSSSSLTILISDPQNSRTSCTSFLLVPPTISRSLHPHQ